MHPDSHLSLKRNSFTNDMFFRIDCVEDIRTLKELGCLDFSYNSITDYGINTMLNRFDDLNIKVDHLNLSHCMIGWQSLNYFRKFLEKNPELQMKTLNLNDNLPEIVKRYSLLEMRADFTKDLQVVYKEITNENKQWKKTE